MRRRRAVYDLLLHAVRHGRVPDEILRRAGEASPTLWQRAIRIEQCAPAVERALRGSGQLSALPDHARALLRRASATAVRNALTIPAQLERIAAVAERHHIPFIALKGAARMLLGEVPGARSVDDIDLLVHERDARRLHAVLASAMSGTPGTAAPDHHLPVLTPERGLPVEIHVRCLAEDSALDELLWRDAATVACGSASLLVPDDTLLAIHTLEHAVLTHWGMRYRLRDVLDVATAFARDVDHARVERWVRASPSARAMRTLLAVASTLEPRIGRQRPGAWRTVARVGRTRLAATFWSRDTRRAERLLTVSSVLAEGSAEGLGRLVRTAVRRHRGRVAAVALAASGTLLGACGDASGPRPLELPAFVFASDAEGSLALYTFEGDVVTRLTPLGAGDDEPHAAAGRIVFSSMRDGNREIYFLSSGGGTRRITVNGSADVEPALRGDAGMIAFVSSRSGTPRLWVVDTLGTAPVALATGSASFVPERGPAWSPSGDRIAFTSTRTGTSQVWIVSAAGGDAAQLSHESGGAFDPAWSADGSTIYYGAASGVPRIMQVVVATGETSVAGEDADGLGQPACDANACLAVRRPYTGDGDIVAFALRPGGAVPVITRAGTDRHPSVLSP